MIDENSHVGIHKLYSGSLGELRNSSFKKLQKEFQVGKKTNLSIKYVVRGQENYLLDNEEICLKAGQALFLKKEKPYQCRIDLPISTQGVCVDLNLDQLRRSTLDPLLEEELFFLDPEFSTQRMTFMNPQLHYAFSRVLHRNPEDDPLYLQEMMIELSIEVLNLEKHYVEKIKSIPTKKLSYKKELFRRLLKAKNHINDQKFQKISLKSLARETHISEFYLQRLFSKVFGFTPSEYVEKLRMTEAAALIKSGKTITDVSFMVGYNDVSYFCRRFKKFYGKTAKQFQSICRT